MSFNKTIQMCIFDGNPNGRIMCELSNWNGRVYKISRNDLSEFATEYAETVSKILAFISFLEKMRIIKILFM